MLLSQTPAQPSQKTIADDVITTPSHLSQHGQSQLVPVWLYLFWLQLCISSCSLSRSCSSASFRLPSR